MALVMSLGILLVLTMLAVAVTTYTTGGQRNASHSSSGVSAYSLAEAGINNAMSVLANQRNAGNAALLPSSLETANVTPYDGGTTTSPPHVKWWGTYDEASTTWAL
jgi:Tfp pilus assembly protein PilX